MLNEQQAKELLGRVLAKARAEETRVSIRGERTSHLRFARNTPSTSGLYDDVRMSIGSTYGKRSASVSLNQLDDAAIEAAVRRSEELARVAPEDPEHMAALGPQSYGESVAPKAIDHDGLPAGVGPWAGPDSPA